jgi:NADH-quinone oxidoreductase subunit J
MEYLHEFLFWTIAAMTGLCALAVVVSQNIVRSATWLLFTLAGTSAIFFLLGADLVGAVQLLVYVGGTLILVVFGVMLTAQGPFITMKTSAAEWAISTVVGILFFSVLAYSVVGIKEGKIGPPKGSKVADFAPKKEKKTSTEETDYAKNAPYSAALGQTFSGVANGPAHEEDGVKGGKVVRAHYLLPFEIVSVHLLVVLIGAAYLARAKRRKLETK